MTTHPGTAPPGQDLAASFLECVTRGPRDVAFVMPRTFPCFSLSHEVIQHICVEQLQIVAATRCASRISGSARKL